MKAYVEPEWMKTNVEEKLENLQIQDNDNENEEVKSNDDDDASEDETENDEDFYCIACDKQFKSDKAFKNHEKSKKHRENVELVKKHMKEDDVKLFFNQDDQTQDDNNELVDNEVSTATEEKTKNR